MELYDEKLDQAGLILAVLGTIRFPSQRTAHYLFELAGYGGLLVMMIALGNFIPSDSAYAGMMVLSFMCFFMLRLICLGWRNNEPSVFSRVYGRRG